MGDRYLDENIKALIFLKSLCKSRKSFSSHYIWGLQMKAAVFPKSHVIMIVIFNNNFRKKIIDEERQVGRQITSSLASHL